MGDATLYVCTNMILLKSIKTTLRVGLRTFDNDSQRCFWRT